MRVVSVALILLVAGCKNAGTYPEHCGQLLPGWVTNEHGFGILGIASDMRLHRDGRVTFNRKPITREKLSEYSRLTGEMNPRAFVTFAVEEGTSCGQVREVRVIIDSGVDCNGDNRGRCGEGPGPWPIFGDVPPFPIVGEYNDGQHRWLPDGMTDEEWLAANAHKRQPARE